ncbi:MAG: hypothetical protein ACPIOQ_82455 [Promethearchaeia archaeon]
MDLLHSLQDECVAQNGDTPQSTVLESLGLKRAEIAEIASEMAVEVTQSLTAAHCRVATGRDD